MSRPRPSHRAVVPLLLALLLAVLAGGPVAAAGAADGPTGPGVVQGVVRDVAGTPIPGATVELGTSARGATDADPWTQTRHETTTDAAGRYRLAGIATPGEGVSVGDVVASAPGFAQNASRGISERLAAAPRTPVDADVLLRRPDVTLRGRISVRGGSAEGGWVTATRAAPDADWAFDRYSAWPDADGRWELRVPAGAYRVSAQSTYGLETWWPDVPAARPGPLTRTLASGDVLDGVDVSMRLRLPGRAVDEYGQEHWGWDPAASESGEVGRYPRDPYRSVTAVRGAALEVGTPRSVYSFDLPRLPAGDLVTVTGTGIIQVEVPVSNPGDDVLWVDAARLEGSIAEASTCSWAEGGECAKEHAVMPGETDTIRITPNSETYAPEYPLTLVLQTSAELLDRRVPLRLRNVGWEEFGANDHRNLRGIHPYLSDEDQALTAGFLGLGPPLPPEVSAWMAAMAAGSQPPASAPAPAPVKRVTPPGVLTLARSSVRFTFPAAGRVDVRIDRLVRAKRKRQPDRWVLARTVALRATRAGARSVRIKRLAVGPYRVRITARIGGRVRRVTDYRDVKP